MHRSTRPRVGYSIELFVPDCRREVVFVGSVCTEKPHSGNMMTSQATVEDTNVMAAFDCHFHERTTNEMGSTEDQNSHTPKCSSLRRSCSSSLR